jgi:RimJ/RimL family protein N-acetyltransferase
VGTPTFRPVTIDDADLAAEIMTASYPDLPEDPVLTRYRWEHPKDEWSTARFLAELDGRPIAFVGWSHEPWEHSPERFCHVEVWLDKAWLQLELLSSLWTWVSAAAEAEGARVLEGYAVEDEAEMLEALDRLGYQRDRIEKVWELNLHAHGERLVIEAREARAKAQMAGVEMVTLAGWSDPDALRKLHSLSEATHQDIPTTYTLPSESYENFVDRVTAPDKPDDRFWVARHGDRPVAMSFMRFPPVRGDVWTGYTCSDREYRGRGLARAVKLQSLAQAVELGVPRVLTGNDSENAAMLHINETLGYDRRPGFVSLIKRVRT